MLTLLRPEVLAMARRSHELIWAAVALAFGLWLIWLGGLVLIPIGAALAGLGLGLGLMGWRRLRFTQSVDAPGLVEIIEGQIGYFGTTSGGFVNLPDLTELRLLTLRGRKLWRLKQADGQALLIPIDAAGAEKLFDAFVSLPGMDSAALIAALPTPHDSGPDSGPDSNSGLTLAGQTLTIWRRGGNRLAHAQARAREPLT